MLRKTIVRWLLSPHNAQQPIGGRRDVNQLQLAMVLRRVLSSSTSNASRSLDVHFSDITTLDEEDSPSSGSGELSSHTSSTVSSSMVACTKGDSGLTPTSPHDDGQKRKSIKRSARLRFELASRFYSEVSSSRASNLDADDAASIFAACLRHRLFDYDVGSADNFGAHASSRLFSSCFELLLVRLEQFGNSHHAHANNTTMSTMRVGLLRFCDALIEACDGNLSSTSNPLLQPRIGRSKSGENDDDRESPNLSALLGFFSLDHIARTASLLESVCKTQLDSCSLPELSMLLHASVILITAQQGKKMMKKADDTSNDLLIDTAFVQDRLHGCVVECAAAVAGMIRQPRGGELLTSHSPRAIEDEAVGLAKAARRLFLLSPSDDSSSLNGQVDDWPTRLKKLVMAAAGKWGGNTNSKSTVGMGLLPQSQSRNPHVTLAKLILRDCVVATFGGQHLNESTMATHTTDHDNAMLLTLTQASTPALAELFVVFAYVAPASRFLQDVAFFLSTRLLSSTRNGGDDGGSGRLSLHQMFAVVDSSFMMDRSSSTIIPSVIDMLHDRLPQLLSFEGNNSITSDDFFDMRRLVCMLQRLLLPAPPAAEGMTRLRRTGGVAVDAQMTGSGGATRDAALELLHDFLASLLGQIEQHNFLLLHEGGKLLEVVVSALCILMQVRSTALSTPSSSMTLFDAVLAFVISGATEGGSTRPNSTSVSGHVVPTSALSQLALPSLVRLLLAVSTVIHRRDDAAALDENFAGIEHRRRAAAVVILREFNKRLQLLQEKDRDGSSVNGMMMAARPGERTNDNSLALYIREAIANLVQARVLIMPPPPPGGLVHDDIGHHRMNLLGEQHTELACAPEMKRAKDSDTQQRRDKFPSYSTVEAVLTWDRAMAAAQLHKLCVVPSDSVSIAELDAIRLSTS